jgi:hypothetical protein
MTSSHSGADRLPGLFPCRAAYPPTDGAEKGNQRLFKRTSWWPDGPSWPASMLRSCERFIEGFDLTDPRQAKALPGEPLWQTAEARPPLRPAQPALRSRVTIYSFSPPRCSCIKSACPYVFHDTAQAVTLYRARGHISRSLKAPIRFRRHDNVAHSTQGRCAVP